MADADLQALTHLAAACVNHTGRMLREQSGRWATAERESDHDVKLLGDRAAEAIAIDLLQRASPYDVFSEECGLVGAQGGELQWVLDPLDGSANYLRGVPCCCVSLALCRAGEPVIGVVYDFNRDELFSAHTGSGTYLNGQAVRVSATPRAEAAILATGFPAAFDYESSALTDFVEGARRFHKVRSIGSAALMLAYVACGRFDVYREHNVRFWDVAAGQLLVREAGGRILDESVETGLERRLRLTAWNGILAL